MLCEALYSVMGVVVSHGYPTPVISRGDTNRASKLDWEKTKNNCGAQILQDLV
jgi:hypothetical protein